MKYLIVWNIGNSFTQLFYLMQLKDGKVNNFSWTLRPENNNNNNNHINYNNLILIIIICASLLIMITIFYNLNVTCNNKLLSIQIHK